MMLTFGLSTVKHIASGDPLPVFQERLGLTLVKREGVACTARVVLVSISLLTKNEWTS